MDKHVADSRSAVERTLQGEAPTYCTHCSGYGTSLKDAGDGPCSVCGGSGEA